MSFIYLLKSLQEQLVETHFLIDFLLTVGFCFNTAGTKPLIFEKLSESW